MTVVVGEYITLNQVLNEFDKIIIPDVQRDYVMASGGDKFTKLLQAMTEVQKKESLDEKFNFSCLVGYKDAQNTLHVYDGQQRLVTLVYLCSYLNAKNMDSEKKLLLEKFYFTDRTEANYWLRNLDLIEEDNATDFTTYSLVQLIKQFEALSDKIDFDFLFNRVVFSLVLVGKISDAQQFFLDINDGLDLKTYEIYKAELYHHARAKLSMTEFKRFSLKMENEWLKFFLSYRYEADEWINNKKIKKIHCEEEMLVFFLQYCTQMICISENKDSNKSNCNNIYWLESNHLLQIEQIIDAVVAEINQHVSGKINCLNSSYFDKFSSGKKMHWSLQDTNYNDMLKLFLKNLYNKDEVKKDVIIWCYISNLPFYKGNKIILNTYLRFIKKILNNNRGVNVQGKMEYGGRSIDYHKLSYYRYLVRDIPAYYGPENLTNDNKTECFINEIIKLNRAYIVNNHPNFIDIYASLCKSDNLKLILEREKKKQKSSEYSLIQSYENLPFINGLVDNLLEYSDEDCRLKDLYKIEMYSKISKEQFWSEKTPYWENKTYKNILKFISDYNINLYATLFSGVKIKWDTYWNGKGSINAVSVLPHTWCDLFTSENGINSQDCSLNIVVKDLPDGWFEGQQIKQPQVNHEGKNQFAAQKYPPITVWNMENFSANFSVIYVSEKGKYIVNGTEQDWLPYDLNRYSEKSWIDEQLAKKKKSFFSPDVYLNKILLNKWKNISLEKGKKFFDEDEKVITFDAYVKLYEGGLGYIELDDDYFFIRIYTIE